MVAWAKLFVRVYFFIISEPAVATKPTGNYVKMLFFSHGQNLIYIISGAILIFLVYLYSTGRKRMWLNSFGGLDILQGFSRIPNITRNIMKGLMASTAFCGLCMVLIGPKWQTTEEYYEREGMEIVFVLDVSLSMLAEDVKPNRLQRAKIEMENLINF